MLCVLGLVISTDFTKYFVIFHHIFFNNDLWLLDPATDLLINIVPEPFFVDTASYIALVFGISVAVIFGVSRWWLRREKRQRKQADGSVRQTHRISVFCLQNHFYDNGDF